MMTACTQSFILSKMTVLYTNLKNIQMYKFFISWHLIVNVSVLAAFYSKSPTTPCSIFLGHFAVSTPTFF